MRIAKVELQIPEVELFYLRDYVEEKLSKKAPPERLIPERHMRDAFLKLREALVQATYP